MLKLPLKTDDLIPHRPPIKMIDSIVEFNDASKSSVLEYKVDKNSNFLNSDGTLDEECFLEIIAQAAAAQHGFNLKRKNSEKEQGLLVGVRHLEIHGKVFAGDTLKIMVQCGTEIETVSSVSGKILKGDQIIAESIITVWHSNEFKE